MPAQRLQFTITIAAPVARVWELMLGPESYKDWTSAFAEGSYYEGAWAQGARIRFLSPSGDGMVAEIVECRPHAFISVRHLGHIVQGVEDYDSPAVRAWAPAYENYSFKAVPGGTELLIDQDISAEYEQYIREAWPRALQRLKVLCEQAT